MRKFAAAERGDGLVPEGGRAGQPISMLRLSSASCTAVGIDVLDRGFPALGLEPGSVGSGW